MTEERGCRVCGSERTEAHLPRSDLPLKRCRECRAVYRVSDLDAKKLAEIYNEDYFLKTWPGSLGRFFHDFNPENHHKTRFFMAQLEKLTKPAAGPGRLLDVGCANGVFVWLARERGWKAEGVELSPFAVEWGQKQFKVSIHLGTIHDLDPGPCFDVITLWDTIEHLPDPGKTLHACYQRLVPGGLVAILTPDADSLVNHLVHAAHWIAPGRSRPYLDKLYHQDHLTCFDRHTLCLALIEQGFEIHWIEGYDEDPRDTETRGLLRAGVFAVRAAAALLNRKHELLIWAAKPGE